VRAQGRAGADATGRARTRDARRARNAPDANPVRPVAARAGGRVGVRRRARGAQLGLGGEEAGLEDLVADRAGRLHGAQPLERRAARLRRLRRRRQRDGVGAAERAGRRARAERRRRRRRHGGRAGGALLLLEVLLVGEQDLRVVLPQHVRRLRRRQPEAGDDVGPAARGDDAMEAAKRGDGAEELVQVEVAAGKDGYAMKRLPARLEEVAQLRDELHPRAVRLEELVDALRLDGHADRARVEHEARLPGGRRDDADLAILLQQRAHRRDEAPRLRKLLLRRSEHGSFGELGLHCSTASELCALARIFILEFLFRAGVFQFGRARGDAARLRAAARCRRAGGTFRSAGRTRTW
jgi:hypothetical protein